MLSFLSEAAWVLHVLPMPSGGKVPNLHAVPLDMPNMTRRTNREQNKMKGST